MTVFVFGMTSGGNPGGKLARVGFINEDNGDYVCRIKSPMSNHTSAGADHSRNLSYARDADGSDPVEHLKV